MRKIRVMSVFGTRPEAVKMAPLIHALERDPAFEPLCCVTGQHRQMLDSVLDSFRLRADYDLDIMQERQTLSAVTTKALLGLETVFQQAKPDLVLVQGDTTTTLAGALAAFYQGIPVGHVEAGLRSFDPDSPFPEEMNRRLVSDIARLHFAPTAAAAEHLRRESVPGEIFVTGNTVIDTMKTTVSPGFRFTEPVLRELDFARKRVIVLTCHRRENQGPAMEQILLAVRQIATECPDVEVVFPVHRSPWVRECARRFLADTERIHLIEPLDVCQMHNLLARCYLVLTDSGGLQEEAPVLGKPVLILRRETERQEAVASGAAKLAGVDGERIGRLVRELLDDPAVYDSMAKAGNPYGDGSAAERIVDAIKWYFLHDRERPEDFIP